MGQKRSETTYQKIDTIFKRDINNRIMPYDGLVYPELEYLRNMKFDAEEKIDGTNCRLEVTAVGLVDGVKFNVDYKGKTDAANMPPHLLKTLQEKYPEDKILASLGLKKMIPFSEFEEHKWGTKDDKTGIFTPDPMKVPTKFIIYGEGYGVKIQKGGNYIKNGVDFIGFDVKIGDTYLLRESRDEILTKLGCPIVPFIGQFTIDEAIEYVKKGFKSTIAENKDYDAEGLVLRTPLGLRTRRGERIIFKVKTCDFRDYYTKYGTYDKVEQIDNPKYSK